MSGVPGVLLLLEEQDTAQGFLIDFIPEPFLFFFFNPSIASSFLVLFPGVILTSSCVAPCAHLSSIH